MERRLRKIRYKSKFATIFERKGLNNNQRREICYRKFIKKILHQRLSTTVHIFHRIDHQFKRNNQIEMVNRYWL